MGQLQPGVGYNLIQSPHGDSLEILFPDYERIVADKLLQQFQIVVNGDRLQVVNGTALWAQHNFDGIGGTNLCSEQTWVDEYARYDGDTVTVGSDTTSPYMSGGGYVTLHTAEGIVWDVWLFQPYDRTTQVDFDPICVVMPEGSYSPGCPGELPTFITGYPTDTKCRYILVGTATKTGDFWLIDQKCIGTLTFPTEEVLDEDQQYDKVIQFELRVTKVEGVDVLKIASGTHIYRQVGTDCDATQKTETLTGDPSGPSPVSIVTGTGSSDPWAQSDGWVEISAGGFYVYAVKVETASAIDFYIYVSKSSTIGDGCPKTIPPGITEPTETYTVQIIGIGDASYVDGVWVVNQNVHASITWPNAPTAAADVPEQFEVRIEQVGEGYNLKVAKGRVISRYSPNSYHGGCLKEFNVKGFAVYPESPYGSFTDGTDTSSPYVDNGGYVTLPAAFDDYNYDVYLILNHYRIDSGTLEPSYPYLAVLRSGGDGDLYTKPIDTCDRQEWKTWLESRPTTITVQTVEDPSAYPPYFIPVNYYIDGLRIGEPVPDYLDNYNYQRVKIATITWNATDSKWEVIQHLIGTLTIPHNIFYGGVTSYLGTPNFHDEQVRWEGSYPDCHKWDGTGSAPTEIIQI